MARIKLELPTHFEFSTELEIRISEINYGNHLSNDAYLSLMHEARLRFFASFGFSEFNLAGVSVIMGDAAIVYKKECHYGDVLMIEVTAAEFGSRSFDLFYRFIKTKTNEVACEAKTGIICYDYKEKKTVNVPYEFRKRFG